MRGGGEHKPRIAVLLSGLPRQWRACLPTQQALLQDYDADFFFHFWDAVDDKEKEEIVSLLKPRAFVFEKPRDFSDADTDPAFRHDNINIPSRMFSQYFSWREVARLVEPFKADYDLGMRSRADLHFVYTLDNVIPTLKAKDLWVSWWKKDYVLSDLFALGGMEPILYFHKLFDHARDYAATREFNSEVLLTAHFEARNDFHIHTNEGQSVFFVRRPHMENYTVEQALFEDPGRNKWLDPEIVDAHEKFHKDKKGEAGASFVSAFRDNQLVTLANEIRLKALEAALPEREKDHAHTAKG